MECLKKPRDDGVCYPVFVDCSFPSLLEETETNKTVKTTGDETENDISGPKDKTSGDDDSDKGVNDTGYVGVGLGALLGMSVATLSLMVLLVLVSGNVIFCLWYQKKRKGKIVRQTGRNLEPHSLHITPNQV